MEAFRWADWRRLIELSEKGARASLRDCRGAGAQHRAWAQPARKIVLAGGGRAGKTRPDRRTTRGRLCRRTQSANGAGDLAEGSGLGRTFGRAPSGPAAREIGDDEIAEDGSGWTLETTPKRRHALEACGRWPKPSIHAPLDHPSASGEPSACSRTARKAFKLFDRFHLFVEKVRDHLSGSTWAPPEHAPWSCAFDEKRPYPGARPQASRCLPNAPGVRSSGASHDYTRPWR